MTELELLQCIVNDVAAPLARIRLKENRHKPDAKAIWQAIIQSRESLTRKYGSQMRFRYAGYSGGGVGDTEDKANRSKFKVLEYLWDFSFSRYRITEAIEQAEADPLAGKFRLVFVAESELGCPTEICRDLLKLAEARAPIRCLIYRRPKKNDNHEGLKARMLRVLSNHETFSEITTGWLFVALNWTPTTMHCEFFTLNENNVGFTPLVPNNQ